MKTETGVAQVWRMHLECQYNPDLTRCGRGQIATHNSDFLENTFLDMC